MKKTSFFLLLFVFIIIANDSYSQWYRNKWKKMRQEIGGGLGVSNFMGELGGANAIGTTGMKDFDIQATRPVMTINYKYYFAKHFAGRSSLTYGWIGGNDENTKEEFRNNRNLHFRSPIVELAATGNYYFFNKKQRGHVHNLRGVRGVLNIDISLYAFAGVSMFYFNPKAKLTEVFRADLIAEGLEPDDKWHSLRDLGTEGQGYYPSRKKYSRIGVAIPFGLGFRYSIDKDLDIEIEYGFRRTFTDYLDDVSTSYVNPEIFGKGNLIAKHFSNPSPSANDQNSQGIITQPGQQRGNPKNKDAFMFANITLQYKLTKGRKKGWSKRRRPRRR